jgi:hypothetical protein
MDCIGWEASYNVPREVNGRTYSQAVHEFLIVTSEGMFHSKSCVNPSGSMRIFSDLDTTFKITSTAASENERIKRHKHFFLMRKAAVAAGSNPSYMPWPTVEDIVKNRPMLNKTLADDSKALNAWNTVLGFDDTPRFAEIVEAAEVIVHDEKQDRMKKVAIAMADVDPSWGMF